jgi:pyruvate ferredoxin oxidoreductase beta subunit
LKAQKRFKHLFDSEKGRDAVRKIQALADENVEKFGL